MPSRTLFPPSLDSSLPAFVGSGTSGTVRLYFSLSKYSSSTSTIRSLHISIVKQSTGQSALNKVDSGDRYRSTGILILNTAGEKVEGQENLYSVDLLAEDFSTGDAVGFGAGWIYKVQLRLSTVPFPAGAGVTWLTQNASNFSEWSRYCVIKAIGQPDITIPYFNYSYSETRAQSEQTKKEYYTNSSTLEIAGEYTNPVASETLYSCQMILTDNNGIVIEDSGVLYSDKYVAPNNFYYKFRYELKDATTYKLKLDFLTINQYSMSIDFEFNTVFEAQDYTDVYVICLDSISNVDDEDFKEELLTFTDMPSELEEGRIAIKMYSINGNRYTGNLCIKRSSSKDNFKYWEEIEYVHCQNQIINEIPPIFDYTVESDVWYKYGVQAIDFDGTRKVTNEQFTPITREFEFSYLLGEGGRQLKLKYNHQMNSYNYNVSEAKQDTIGDQYPFVIRSGKMKYRTIPIAGLISFNMDDNETFTNDKELYKYNDIVKLYQDRRDSEYITQYDFRRELDFREKVLEFLQDGKPKLFKSPTEGNIIVRLMNVTTQPQNSIDRLISSFTATGYEIAEATMENYAKYGFYEPGTYWTEEQFSYGDVETHIGQLDIDLYTAVGTDENQGNLLQQILNKYDYHEHTIAGEQWRITKIHHVRLEFPDPPLRVVPVSSLTTFSSTPILGNSIAINGVPIVVEGTGTRVYEVDERLEFEIPYSNNQPILSASDSIFIYGENSTGLTGDTNRTTVHVTADFLYDIVKVPYTERQLKNRSYGTNIGQLSGSYAPSTNLYTEIQNKYFYDWITGNTETARKLDRVQWVSIEATPGTIFAIYDGTDNSTQAISNFYHEINLTGVLNLEGLGYIKSIRYIGVRKEDGTIDTTARSDIILNYLYWTIQGYYE